MCNALFCQRASHIFGGGWGLARPARICLVGVRTQPSRPWEPLMGRPSGWWTDEPSTQLVFSGTVCSRRPPRCCPPLGMGTGMGMRLWLRSLFLHHPPCLSAHAGAASRFPHALSLCLFQDAQEGLPRGSKERKLVVGNVGEVFNFSFFKFSTGSRVEMLAGPHPSVPL